MPTVLYYSFATLPPLILIILGAIIWPLAATLAVIWLTAMAGMCDVILPRPKQGQHPNAYWPDILSALLAIGHFVALVVVIHAMGRDDLRGGTQAMLVLASASFFGQVSHPNAHELIHHAHWAMRALGAAVYTGVGFGHHVSAHRLVHHRYVGTKDDPNTPRAGEGFWAYLPRAWIGSFRAGLQCELDRQRRHMGRANALKSIYVIWIIGPVLAAGIAYYISGITGVCTLIGLGLLTGAQILLSDYIQHYGLSRLTQPNGRVEPVGPHHSWNAPRGFTTYLMLNAPAHSEHHMRPHIPYDRLNPAATAPTLPYAMPVMAILALMPGRWRRMMDQRAQKVMDQHRTTRHSPAPSGMPLL